MTLEKVVLSVQVIILLPFNRNPSSHNTVSSVPVSTGNVVSVLRFFQARFNPVHAVGCVPERYFKLSYTLLRDKWVKRETLECAR